MATSKTGGDGITYEGVGKGVHRFTCITHKPFAEFKEELNQAYDNSWIRSFITITWRDTEVTFASWGSSGTLIWDGGRISAELRITQPPATWFEQKIVWEVRQMLVRACTYARTAEIDAENKESLRQAALQTYYDAWFNECEADILIARWQVVDETTKVLAALTSSTSAVSGWYLWKNPDAENWIVAWKIVAGLASVLSIVHVALKVSDRVKDWSDTKGHFVRLRTELETLLYQMKVNPAFDLEEFMVRFGALRTRFGEGVDRKKVDFLAFNLEGRARSVAKEHYDTLKSRTSPAVIAAT